MSTLYNLEPQPTAKVLLITTSGELILELFAKQIPLASRNFLQHCLDGYYNDTIFHRLVPGFIIQGGDPTGTGQGGEAALPGGPFEDEFHSRLKFNRRGLVGMANGGGKNDNGSQFFLTLAETPELQSRNTMFGRILGDTIYNLMKMGDAELEAVEGSERPLYPTKITGSEVLVNPFDDLIKREPKPKPIALDRGQAKDAKRKQKKKGGKALLSFGNDDGDAEGENPLVKKEKYNPKLVKIGENNEVRANTQVNGKAENREVRPEKTSRRRLSRSLTPPATHKPNAELQLPLPNDEKPSRSPSSSPEPVPVAKVNTLLDKTNAQIANLKASMKRNISNAPATDTRKKSKLEQMVPENAMRGRKRKLGAQGNSEKDTMNLLNAFRTRLEKAGPVSNDPNATGRKIIHPTHANGEQQIEPRTADDEAELCDLHFIANCQSCQSWDSKDTRDGVNSNEDGPGWMSHMLTFEKDRLGKDLTWKQADEESSLVVIDPREKAMDIREEQRAKKLAKIGGKVGHVTEWGRDRDKGKMLG